MIRCWVVDVQITALSWSLNVVAEERAVYNATMRNVLQFVSVAMLAFCLIPVDSVRADIPLAGMIGIGSTIYLVQDSGHGADPAEGRSVDLHSTADQSLADHADDNEDSIHQPLHGDEGEVAHHGDDAGMEKASHLVIHEVPGWYPWVIAGVIALFVLAGTLGSAAVIVRGAVVDESHH